MHLHWLRKIWRFPRTALKRFVSDLLRLVLLSHRPRRMAQRGFVLPTTVVLVLMVMLMATTLTYRGVIRSQTSIAQREQVVVASAAAPAIDRATAKIEFLFKGDTRLPAGLPTSAVLVSMLRNDGSASIAALTPDPYNLPGETRLDINGDGTVDTAWSFQDRSTNPPRTVVYSVLAADQAGSVSATSPESLAKARALVTRTGPLDMEGPRAATCPGSVQARDGWFPVNPSNTSRLLKNFQINVFMVGGTEAGRTREAFEFQESRVADRLNKWSAWFRTDLEISPDANFAFNGAMHTDGSLIVGASGGSNFTSYMVSSHNSCIYTADASEITMRQTGNGATFQGQAMRGTLATNAGTAGNTNTFHVWNGDNSAPNTSTTLTNDSVNTGTPEDVSLNPIHLIDNNGVWRNTEQYDNAGTPTNTLQHRGTVTRDTAWQTNPLREGVAGEPRLYNDNYLDPLSADLTLAATSRNGFWENEAQTKGLRFIVGPRLELGNPIQWNFDPTTREVRGNIDGLYPPTSSPSPLPAGLGANQYRQRRSLRDNLAAVQTMAIYRSTGGGIASDGDFPMICYALTAHPGTPQSIVNSRTFTYTRTGALKINFFNGEGTNGWEFAYHPSFDTAREFAQQIASTNPLGTALRNLANFAGAPTSATNAQKSYFSMWGDFSKLRQVLAKVDRGTAYSALTFDEKSTLHTAACTMSALAYNIQTFDGNVIRDRRLGFCYEATEVVRYPSLYYLFPVEDHTHAGTGTHLQPNGTYTQYGIENYAEEYVSNTTRVNGSFTYRIVGVDEVAAVPRLADLSNWVLPVTTNGTPLTAADIDNSTFAFRINRPSGSADVPILDKGMFDGREQMAIRVSDIDLKALTQTSGKIQIPDHAGEAIVYATREDAVADATPLDFLPDSNRRPHGFRLRNGADLSKAKARTAGLTFVTNNSAYILGNFNLHSTDGTFANRIEEFTSTLEDNAWTTANFYTNRTRATLNANFAQTATDTWRPAEILADAITLLSGTFKDGAVEDTFNATADPKTSYMNQIRPAGIKDTVKREDGSDVSNHGELGSAVWIDRSGSAFVAGATDTPGEPIPTSTWTSSNDGQAASDTYVNATFFSGMAPSRKQQSNGGLPNFVRLTELWAGKILNIQGSFIQFDFSRMATAPFDQEAWEPGATPGNTDQVGYYSPPSRRWSYDVGLAVSQPGPAASRFLTLRSPRSEYFRTLSNDDPYITVLRCAVDDDNNRVFPNETCPA
jgi:type II secretory pathway pseudopilin PulG